MSSLIDLKRKKAVEKEFYHRKELADSRWDKIMLRIEHGEVPNKFEIASAMHACDLADGSLLNLKHKQ